MEIVSRESHSRIKRGVWSQTYSSFVVSVGFLGCGVVGGWTGPALSLLDEDFEMGPSEVALVVNMGTIGCTVGTLFTGKSMDVLGRKKLMLAISPIFAVGWIIMGLAGSIQILYIGRFITGFSTAFLFTAGQIYIGEIGEPSLRGRLGSISGLLLSVGVLVGYSVGGFLHWRNSCYAFVVPEIVLFLGLLTVPESPHWYLLKNRRADALKSLISCRDSNILEVEKELNEMSQKLLSVGADVSYGELLKPRTRYPLFIGLFAYSVQQLAGLDLIMQYVGSILEATNSSVKLSFATTAIGIAQLISTIVSLTLIDKFGRRLLLSVSAVAAGLLLLTHAAYHLSASYRVQWPPWMPVFIMVCLFFCYSIGCRSIPYIVGSEVFNTAIRSKANSLCQFYTRVINALLVQAFPFMVINLGSHWVFFILGTTATFLGVLTCFIVPETKGKSLEEIQEYFEEKTKPIKKSNSIKVEIVNPAFVITEENQL